MTRQGPIGVTGASAEVGGRVARRIADRGLAQRLVVRDAARAPRLPGVEVTVAGDYGDTEAMTEALAGLETVFLVPASEDADRMRLHRSAVGAAVAAGVERIVVRHDGARVAHAELRRRALSAFSGRPVTYRVETLEQAYASRASYGAPQFEVDGWVTSYVAVATGELDVVSGTVSELAGHRPQTLPEFLAANPASYAHLVPS